MKEIFVVSSYAKSPPHVEILASMIDFLTTSHRDICLVSHLPIPERLLNDNVKFTIFDPNNIIGPPVGGAYYKFLDMEVRCNPADFYHGAAVYLNLFHALKLLKQKYDWVHFLESDLEPRDVQNHLDHGFAPLQGTPDLSVIAYPLPASNPTPSPTAIVTNILSLRPDIVDLLPRVFSWDDYARACVGHVVILEEWLLNQFKARNIKYALLPDTRMANKFRLGGDHTIFKCRQINGLFLVFVINDSTFDLDVKSQSGRGYLVKSGHVHWLADISPDDELSVAYVGLDKVFRYPMETLRLGVFKKRGADLCPDWSEDRSA